MANKTAFMFPGQGSQEVGMGQDLVDAFPVASDTFAEADDVLGFSLSTLCFEGPAETLNDTLNTQPALVTTSVAVLRALHSAGWEVNPAFVAGHSLGEYSALAAADAVSFSDVLRLVRERGRLMKKAGEISPGGMAAIIRLDADLLDDICRQASQQTGQVVQAANYNSPGQVVISGDNEALELAMEMAKEAGARRAQRLAVSIAAHSPLMSGIVDEFRQVVNDTPLEVPAVPVIANVTARPLDSVEVIREEMVAQLTSSVRWTESIEYMASQGVIGFVEIGPKQVLAGLLGRIDKSLNAIGCGTAEEVNTLAAV